MPLLVFSVFSYMAAFAILLPSIMYFLQNMGASKAEATQILALYSLTQFVVGPLLGKLSDHVGRKPVIVVTMFTGAACYALLSEASSLFMVTILMICAGVCSGGVPVVFAAAADGSTAERRAAHMGFLGAGIGAAFSVGPMVGAFLGDGSAVAATISTPAKASAIVLLLGVCAATIWRPVILEESSVSPESENTKTQRGILTAWHYIATHPVLFLLCMMMAMFTISLAVMEPILPYLMKDSFDWGPRNMGLLMGYGGFIVILTQGGLVGRLAKKYGERKLVSAGIMLMALGLSVIALSPWMLGVFVGITFTGVGGSLFNSSVLAIGSHHAGQKQRGMVMGSLQAMQSLGRSTGPVMAGYLYQVWTILPFAIGVYLMMLLLLLLPRLKKQLEVTA